MGSGEGDLHGGRIQQDKKKSNNTQNIEEVKPFTAQVKYISNIHMAAIFVIILLLVEHELLAVPWTTTLGLWYATLSVADIYELVDVE